MADEIKIKCTKCQEFKPATAEFFSADHHKRNGFASWCRLCYSAKTREHYRRDPVTRRRIATEYYEENKSDRLAYRKAYLENRRTKPLAYLLLQVKISSHKKGWQMNLTAADIERMWIAQEGRCYWWNVPLIASGQLRHPQRPSIDRLDCYRCYDPDNVVITCMAANLARSSNTVECFDEFCELVRESISQRTRRVAPKTV